MHGSASRSVLVARGAATWWGSDQVWVRPEIRHEGRHEEHRAIQVAIGGSGVALQAVWEAGLRPESGSGSSGWRAQAFGRSSGPELALRPDDIEIRADVTADFEVVSAQPG